MGVDRAAQGPQPAPGRGWRLEPPAPRTPRSASLDRTSPGTSGCGLEQPHLELLGAHHGDSRLAVGFCTARRLYFKEEGPRSRGRDGEATGRPVTCRHRAASVPSEATV